MDREFKRKQRWLTALSYPANLIRSPCYVKHRRAQYAMMTYIELNTDMRDPTWLCWSLKFDLLDYYRKFLPKKDVC